MPCEFHLEVQKLWRPAWRPGTDGRAEEAGGRKITEISSSFTLPSQGHHVLLLLFFKCCCLNAFCWAAGSAPTVCRTSSTQQTNSKDWVWCEQQPVIYPSVWRFIPAAVLWPVEPPPGGFQELDNYAAAVGGLFHDAMRVLCNFLSVQRPNCHRKRRWVWKRGSGTLKLSSVHLGRPHASTWLDTEDGSDVWLWFVALVSLHFISIYVFLTHSYAWCNPVMRQEVNNTSWGMQRKTKS